MLAEFFFSMLCWMLLMPHGFFFSMIPWAVTGFYFLIVTQVSHLQKPCLEHNESLPFSAQQIYHSVLLFLS